jgi:hypothetical protein
LTKFHPDFIRKSKNIFYWRGAPKKPHAISGPSSIRNWEPLSYEELLTASQSETHTHTPKHDMALFQSSSNNEMDLAIERNVSKSFEVSAD